MSWVAASGWDRNETWEAATSRIVAFARSAMNRCSASGIALSSVPSRYQHGSVFHAGGPDGAAANAAAAQDRWAALDEHGHLIGQQRIPATLEGYQTLRVWAERWPRRW